MMNLSMYVFSLCIAVAPPASAPILPPVPAQPPTPSAADKPPSLDEALGLGDGAKQSDITSDASELQRSLDGAKPRDILNSAIDDMKRSAQLLEANDSGISTKRVQESVVRKLDELIATAQRMKQQQSQQGQDSQGQQSQGQSGKSKNQGAKDGKDGKDGQDGKKPELGENGQPRGGRDGKQDQDGANGKRRADGDATSNEPPELADPTMNDAQFDEGRAEWGRLPPRVREAVRQGLRDPMSAAYRQLTQDYYRRLAEEPKR
ncbi:MAG: hypothetical protein RIR77_241 [Planctomycetota bacterium]|jgi:hypothetical protein